MIQLNAVCAATIDKASVKQLMEMTMTTANMLYLLMAIGVFAAFSAMLAHVSWLQSRVGPDMIAKPAGQAENVHQAELSEAHPPLAA